MKGSILGALVCAMLATGAAQAQDKMQDKLKDKGDRTIAQYSCKDVMRESGANRDVAVAFLHGYLLGRSGGDKFNVELLRKETDAFIERCLDNPGMKAADAMTAAKK
jgi:hypothetical protein